MITGLLQRVVAAQEAQRLPEETGATEGQQVGGRRDVCPYPGLRPFEGREARWFFGREELTAHVIGRMAEQLDRGAPLLLIGPSGAGKSSLLRAGVIPGLRDGLLPVPGSRHWPRVLVSRPGPRPLAHAWADMQRDPGSLYRGTRLANARNWRAAGDNEAELTGLEREFLDAAAAEEDAQRAAAELRRQRERRQNQRLRALAGGLAVVLAAAIAAGGIAVANGRSATSRGKLELSGAFAAQSQNGLTTNLRTADLDALAGWQADQTATSRSGLLSSEANPYLGSLPAVGYEPVNLAISPDSRLLAAGGPFGKGGAGVQVWNLTTRKQIADFPGHGPELDGLAFSPDGSTLAAAVGSGHGTTVLRFWDVSTRKPLPDPVRLTGDMITVSLAYSPGGKILALGGALLASGPGGLRLYPVVELWDLAAHRLLHQLISTATAPFWSVAFSPDGRLLAAGGQDGTVRLWNVSTGRQQAVLSSSPAVQSVVFSPDGRYLAGSSSNGTVEVWEAPGPTAAFGLAVRLTSTVALPRPIAFSAGGQYLYVVAGTNDVYRYDLVTVTLAGVPLRLQQNIGQMLASPDGKTLVLAGGNPDGHVLAVDTGTGTVQFWDTRRHRTVGSIATGAGASPLAVAFSPDGTLLATAGADDRIRS